MMCSVTQNIRPAIDVTTIWAAERVTNINALSFNIESVSVSRSMRV